jgi:phosphate starvation-inducible protein PhoH and related proteins
MTTASTHFQLTPKNQQRLMVLCGQFDEHLKQIEKYLHVTLQSRGHEFFLSGDNQAIDFARQVLKQLYLETAEVDYLTPEHIRLVLQQTTSRTDGDLVIHTKAGAVKPLSTHQRDYLQRILQYDINFGIGPAGTGKTYLAVACAVAALEKMQVKRILLVRPVIEAGEHLGFLPGTMVEKVDPYFRPIYDALYDMMGFEKVAKLIEKQIIEIAPLAYMRGRTLNDAFIILDEAQNTTREQMKMFLTRIGFGSKAVITGDITQTDLPPNKKSGLQHALTVLENIPHISHTRFDARDVVRHPLVQAIIEAYEKFQDKS